MKAWISKYALTKGVFEIEAEQYDPINNRLIRNVKNYREVYYGDGRDWHKTKDEAIERAESLKQLKIDNLKKQIKKLENTKFE